jgi:hypothetical protein
MCQNKKKLETHMLLNVHKIVGVEMIRDGGSFAAKFETADGNRYMLFTKIQLVNCGPKEEDERGYHQEKELADYDEPLIIDCDPANRPPDTVHRIYSDFCGPKTRITWDQARHIIDDVARLAPSLRPIQAGWLQQMVAIIHGDGHPPSGSKTRSTWMRAHREATPDTSEVRPLNCD